MAGLFRDQIKAGDLLIGTLVTLASPEVTEIMVEVGFDWLFIDCEHAPFEAQTAQALLQAAGDRCPCAIRVPSGDKVWIKKALDIGAAGIIVPQVNSPEQAERVVRLCKYHLKGRVALGLPVRTVMEGVSASMSSVPTKRWRLSSRLSTSMPSIPLRRSSKCLASMRS